MNRIQRVSFDPGRPGSGGSVLRYNGVARPAWEGGRPSRGSPPMSSATSAVAWTDASTIYTMPTTISIGLDTSVVFNNSRWGCVYRGVPHATFVDEGGSVQVHAFDGSSWAPVDWFRSFAGSQPSLAVSPDGSQIAVCALRDDVGLVFAVHNEGWPLAWNYPNLHARDGTDLNPTATEWTDPAIWLFDGGVVLVAAAIRPLPAADESESGDHDPPYAIYAWQIGYEEDYAEQYTATVVSDAAEGDARFPSIASTGADGWCGIAYQVAETTMDGDDTVLTGSKDIRVWFFERLRDGTRASVTTDGSSRDPCLMGADGVFLLGWTYFSGSGDLPAGREIRLVAAEPLSAAESGTGSPELDLGRVETLAEYRDYSESVNFAAFGVADGVAYATWEVGEVNPDEHRYLDGVPGSGVPPSWGATEDNPTAVDKDVDSAQYASVFVDGSTIHLFWVAGFGEYGDDGFQQVRFMYQSGSA